MHNGLSNNRLLTRLMLSRYFVLHLKAIKRNFFNFKKLFLYFLLSFRGQHEVQRKMN